MQLLDLPRESKGVEFDPFSENSDVLPTSAKHEEQIKTAPGAGTPRAAGETNPSGVMSQRTKGIISRRGLDCHTFFEERAWYDANHY